MKLIVNTQLLRRAAARVILFITENTTDRGVDKNGKPFKPYSVKPFFMPSGAYINATTKSQRAKLEASNSVHFKSSKGGKRYVIIEGGYANFKAARFPQHGGKVNLHYSGTMMGSLAVIGEDANSITIGFTTKEAAERAYYHIVSGAGKSKVKRDFLGITKDQLEEVTQLLKSGISLDPREVIKNITTG